MPSKNKSMRSRKNGELSMILAIKPVSEINFVDEELSHHGDVHSEVTDNLCHDFEAECYVQTTKDTESGQDATKTE